MGFSIEPGGRMYESYVHHSVVNCVRTYARTSNFPAGKLLSNTVQELGYEALDFLIQIGRIAFVAVLYFLIAFIVIKLVVKRLQESPVLARYGKNGSMIAFRLISIGVYLIAVVGVLSYMGVNTTGILTLASAFTVAIGLALQDVMRNLISGLFMLAERPFSVGDRVMVRDRTGTVQGIDIRTTMLRTDDGALLLVPNQLMFTEILQNKSRYNMRLVRYTIKSDLPIDQLLKVLNEIAERIESVRPPLEAPELINHDENLSEWQVGFAVNTKQMLHDHEIGEAIVTALPNATIARVPEE